MPILFGMVALSAGLGHAVSHIVEPLPGEYAALLGAGAALYLLGTAAFRRVIGLRPIAGRLTAAAAALASIPAGVGISAFAQVGLLIAAVVGFIAIESVTPRAVAPSSARSDLHLAPS